MKASASSFLLNSFLIYKRKWISVLIKFIHLAFLQRAEANKDILSHSKTEEEFFFKQIQKRTL